MIWNLLIDMLILIGIISGCVLIVVGSKKFRKENRHKFHMANFLFRKETAPVEGSPALETIGHGLVALNGSVVLYFMFIRRTQIELVMVGTIVAWIIIVLLFYMVRGASRH